MATDAIRVARSAAPPAQSWSAPRQRSGLLAVDRAEDVHLAAGVLPAQPDVLKLGVALLPPLADLGTAVNLDLGVRTGVYGRGPWNGEELTMPIVVNPVAEWVMPGQPFTREDRDRLPEDGHRYELIDGVLIVSPSPSWTHQRVIVRLATQLAPLCLPGLELLVAPFDVDLAADTVLQPDVLIAAADHLIERRLNGPPVLAIEVLSSSTHHLDLAFKRSRYESAGCPSYWVVDSGEPSVVAWELVDGRYREAARAVGAEKLEVSQPFPVVLVPRSLTN